MSVMIDYELIMCKDMDTAASVTTAAVDLGKNGANLTPLYTSVKLTQGVASGSITTIKLQTAADEAFSSPVDEVTITVPASIKQTRPCNLAQFHCPISPQNRYARLVISGSNPAGGKLWAYITGDVQVPL